jgi:DNA polymerase-3 subunit gamma/tau
MNTRLARKYRPATLEDVIGQKQVVGTIKQAAINNVFAQSYLFTGTRGSGKTSIARILANLMTCEKLDNGKLCGQCHACKTVPSNSSMDVKELDGASNNGVEEARRLKDAALYPPTELNRKVYIIDESHMLTASANNALLKIVEEPPSYLHFIFCTTEPKKILSTIISRCQRFDFHKIPSKEIANRLKMISEKENISIDDDALFSMAKMARGSVRDAIGYLEQVGTVGINKKITDENVNKYFGSCDRKGIFNIVKAIKSFNVALLMDQVNDLILASADIKSILYEISEIFRSIMIIKAQEGLTKLIDLPDFEIEELKKIGNDLTLSQLLKLSHVFTEIERKLDYNINERWVIEATLINCVMSLRKQSE